MRDDRVRFRHGDDGVVGFVTVPDIQQRFAERMARPGLQTLIADLSKVISSIERAVLARLP